MRLIISALLAACLTGCADDDARFFSVTIDISEVDEVEARRVPVVVLRQRLEDMMLLSTFDVEEAIDGEITVFSGLSNGGPLVLGEPEDSAFRAWMAPDHDVQDHRVPDGVPVSELVHTGGSDDENTPTPVFLLLE